MQNEEKVLTYLQNIASGIESLKRENKEIGRKIERLEESVESLDRKTESVERSLSERIEGVERSLNERIEGVERSLNEKIEGAEKTLNESIENSHEALLGLITHNKENIELLLFPFNDRNTYSRGEVDKIPDIERRLDEVETVVGNHSEAIRKLSYA